MLVKSKSQGKGSMKSTSRLLSLFIAFASSLAVSENDNCVLVSAATESNVADIKWENKHAMELIKQNHKQGQNNFHLELGKFSAIRLGGNWTFQVELNSGYKMDAKISLEFPPETAVAPDEIRIEPKIIHSTFVSTNLFYLQPVQNTQRHLWNGHWHLEIHPTELLEVESNTLDLSMHVGVEYINSTSIDATRQQCQDPKNVVQLARSSDSNHGTATKSVTPLSRIAIAWRLKGPGKYFYLANEANSFVTLGELFIYSNVLFSGDRILRAALWNFGTFKTIVISAFDNTPQSVIAQSRMNVTILPEHHEQRLNDMSRYLVQEKRAELYVNETDLLVLKDSFTIVVTFDPTPGQFSP